MGHLSNIKLCCICGAVAYASRAAGLRVAPRAPRWHGVTLALILRVERLPRIAAALLTLLRLLEPHIQ